MNTRELAAHLGVPERTLRYRLRALDGLVVGVEVDGVRLYSPEECDAVARACGLFSEGRSAAEVRRVLQGQESVNPASTLPAIPTRQNGDMVATVSADLAAIRSALEAIAAALNQKQGEAVSLRASEAQAVPMRVKPNPKAVAAVVRLARRSGVSPRQRRAR